MNLEFLYAYTCADSLQILNFFQSLQSQSSGTKFFITTRVEVIIPRPLLHVTFLAATDIAQLPVF
jgi:hypothetical protein